MPLDTGALTDTAATTRREAFPASPAPRLLTSVPGDIGSALRTHRESRGLTLEDIARTTRVHAAHIAAIETMDTARLPAGPFAIGYVRAYADALGLETEQVVRRFKDETTGADSPAPPRVFDPDAGRGPPLRLRVVLIGALVAAVAGWHLARHAEGRSRPAASADDRAPAIRIIPVTGPVRLGAPLPAPPEAATPPVYQTPGLATAGAESPSATPGPASSGSPVTDDGSAGSRYMPAGVLYRMGGPASDVILQARKPASLVVRGPAGAVYFARQLDAGEAWRAPALGDLVVDVDDPSAVEVFAGGVAKGVLKDAKTPLRRLESTAPAS